MNMQEVLMRCDHAFILEEMQKYNDDPAQCFRESGEFLGASSELGRFVQWAGLLCSGTYHGRPICDSESVMIPIHRVLVMIRRSEARFGSRWLDELSSNISRLFVSDERDELADIAPIKYSKPIFEAMNAWVTPLNDVMMAIDEHEDRAHVYGILTVLELLYRADKLQPSFTAQECK